MRYLLVILLSFSTLSHAITLEQLQQTFASQQVVRADFVQQRQIKNINRPLVSKGKMILSAEHGLWWQQTMPFVMTMILNDKAMVQKIADQPDQRITAESNPQMFQFNSLMRALVQADKDRLAENFTLDFTDLGKGQWQLILTPMTSPLDKLFETIRLQGSNVLEHVILTDKQNDKTEITFLNHQLTPAKLTQEEAARFE